MTTEATPAITNRHAQHVKDLILGQSHGNEIIVDAADVFAEFDEALYHYETNVPAKEPRPESEACLYKAKGKTNSHKVFQGFRLDGNRDVGLIEMTLTQGQIIQAARESVELLKPQGSKLFMMFEIAGNLFYVKITRGPALSGPVLRIKLYDYLQLIDFDHDSIGYFIIPKRYV